MRRLDVVAFSASAICPYKLAKKNTGMNAIMAIPRMTFSTVNVLVREDVHVDQG